MKEFMNSEKGDAPAARGRVSRPFAAVDAAHTVVKAAEQLGYDLSDPEAFLQRAQLVEYGLTAEVEFAAVLCWLCARAVVHRLGEEVLYDKDVCAWEVPDLFAVFAIDSVTLGTVIEVKTTKANTLSFKKDYLAKLQAYADLVSKPLLIAW